MLPARKSIRPWAYLVIYGWRVGILKPCEIMCHNSTSVDGLKVGLFMKINTGKYATTVLELT